MSERAPAFQFYAKDWLADGHVISMNLEERGAYIHLMAVYWNDGGLPAEPRALADILGVSLKTFERIWQKVGRCFERDVERILQKRLEKEKAKQAAYRDAQRLKGKRSAKSRVSVTDTQPRLNPVATEKQPNTNSPSPSSSSSPDTSTPVGVDVARAEPPMPIPPGAKDNSEIDRANAIHAEIRGGPCAFVHDMIPIFRAYPETWAAGWKRFLQAQAGKPRASPRDFAANAKHWCTRAGRGQAPSWDRGISTVTEAEAIAWDDRLGPRPLSETHQKPAGDAA